MQDRYAGDVGDFCKFGLLRDLAASTNLRLGVNWYRCATAEPNADGRHVAYLLPAARHHASLRACDPDLMERLAAVVDGDRSVAALEAAGVLPAGTVTHAEPVPSGKGPERHAWHRRALARLRPAELVFVDPDNGMSDRPGPQPAKFVLSNELRDYADRGQALIVYQHADRSRGGVAAQVPRRLRELGDVTGLLPAGAVVARRGTCRFFLVAGPRALVRSLQGALQEHARRWQPHVEWVPWP